MPRPVESWLECAQRHLGRTLIIMRMIIKRASLCENEALIRLTQVDGESVIISRRVVAAAVAEAAPDSYVDLWDALGSRGAHNLMLTKALRGAEVELTVSEHHAGDTWTNPETGETGVYSKDWDQVTGIKVKSLAKGLDSWCQAKVQGIFPEL